MAQVVQTASSPNGDAPADDGTEDLTRAELHEPRTFAERVADGVASGIGSWRFIIIQTILVIIWVAINITGFILQWDPYPFILLNLMFSVQAAYTGPILLLAGNRQAARDRAMAQRDDEELGLLLKLQQEQMQVLQLLKAEQETHVQLTRMLQQHLDAAKS